MEPETLIYENAHYPTKFNLGSNSTVDAEHGLQEEPVVCWQPIWNDCTCLETGIQSCYFCPRCLKKVNFGSLAKVTNNGRNKQYYAHRECEVEEQYITEFTKLAQKTYLDSLTIDRSVKIGSPQYLTVIQLNHSLNSYKFYAGCSKLTENQKNQIFEDFDQKQANLFQPNKILIPVREFSVSFMVQNLTGSTVFKKILKFVINLEKQAEEGIQVVSFNDGEVEFKAEIQIISTLEKKRSEVAGFNLKYPFPIEESDIIKFRKYSLLLSPEQNSYGNDFRKGSYYDGALLQNLQSPYTYDTNLPEMCVLDSEGGYKFQEVQEDEEETRLFIDRVKTQLGSKDFQKKAKNLKFEEIEDYINKILPHLSEVVLNDYANYMFQSLLSVCNFQQRIRIIESSRKQFANLVCSQQGTFVFQQLIGYLSKTEEFELICDIVIPENYKLFMDAYGNHFMRKLIKCMPKHLIYGFIPDVLANLLGFSFNQNAVCVLKCVLKALKQGENIIQQLYYEGKRILDTITLNTRELINDEFGNYIIQEVYDIFPQDRLSGITEYIIKNFSRCSCEKYSSNVLQNCVKKYWPKDESIFKSLKNCLENKSITYMYYNKQGNKILLEIMSMKVQLTIKDKIRSLIMYEPASKFNNRRWAEVIGKAKTGAVGASYNSFSEAHHQAPKKKNYK